MKKLTPAASGAHGGTESEGTSRREFLRVGGGAAAGAALILVTPKAASVGLDENASATPPKPVVTKPSGRAPREPVTAYVRNAKRGEVTVMSGKQEITYKDPALVRRLTDAAGGSKR